MDDNSILIAFAGELKHKSLDLYYDFEVDRNFYYITGLDTPGSILMMVKEKGAAIPFLFVPRLSKYDEVMLGETRPESWYREKTGIQAVLYLEDFETQLNMQGMRFGVTTIYLCGDKLLLLNQPSVEGQFAAQITASMPGVRIAGLGA